VSEPKLLVASGNRGKVREIRIRLRSLGFQVIGPDELPEPVPVCAEQGTSFCENARAKAAHWHRFSGLATLADDSGLEVEALDGAPGIRSARFAGENATDGDNIDLLLKKLAGLEEDKRGARFVCCLALCTGEGSIKTFTGSCSGRILTGPAGEGGFGYDPVFFYPPLNRSFAQVSTAEKNRVSHRARALEKLCLYLSKSGL